MTKQAGWASPRLVLVAFLCFAQCPAVNAKNIHVFHTDGLAPTNIGSKGNFEKQESFTAAVYSHRTIPPVGPDKPNWEYAKSIINENLDVYEEQIAIAAEEVVCTYNCFR